MNTKFSTTRNTTAPTDRLTTWTHEEDGLLIDLQANIGVRDSSPRCGVLELNLLQHVIGILQGRAAVLQAQEPGN